MAASSLRNLNLSGDEISKLSKAFADEKFRELFRHYVDEINDPDNRKQYEDEITKLEKELGRDVVFIKPQPSYVIKTIANSTTKAYINFCTSEAIAKFSSCDAEQNNIHGINFSIPYSISPVQSKYDKSNNVYFIYTLVFHPETLRYVDQNDAVKKLVHDTAFAAVEKTYNTRLDKINFVELKKSHKGSLEHTLIRHSNPPSDVSPAKENGHNADDYTEPSYSIVYRDEKDLQNCTNDTFSKLNALIPTHTLVEIKLPQLNSIQNTKLEVKSSYLHLQNDDPVKYKVSIPLVYEVDEDRSSAKFYPDRHILKVEIPIKRRSKSSDQSNDKLSRTTALITEINDKLENLKVDNNTISAPLESNNDDNFLREDIKYKVPEHYCNYYQNKLAFVLKVRNVCYDSFKYRIFDDRKGCIIKFSTLGAGHFPMYYSFCALFDDNLLQTEEPLQYLIEDENVFIYLHLEKGKPPLEYLAGSDKDNLKKSYLNEPEAIQLQINDKKESSLDVTLEVTKFAPEQVTLMISPENNLDTRTSTPKPKTEMATGKVIANQDKLHNQFLDNINFSKFPVHQTTNSEDEKHSLSESELIFEISRESAETETNAEVENHSWIVDSKSVKKSRRKKRPVEKQPDEDSFDGHKSENEDHDGVFSEGTQPIDIQSAYKYSDMSRGSILKKNRSFSESSGDELYHVETSRSYSVDDVNFSSDSYSQSAPKKSVTFNDVISKKLYSSDISILEQRKRSKRRTQRKERRASESDTSETESSTNSKIRQDLIRFSNENLQSSETELTSVSESGETSDDQSDTQDGPSKPQQHIPSSKKNHKRRGKKSARKNASTAKYNIHGDY